MVPAQNSIAVIHLIRCANGPEPFRAFLNSYRHFSAGADHQLVLIFKGFQEHIPAEYLAKLDAIDYIKYIYSGDDGFDIGPYFEVGQELDFDYFCFLNSFSTILCDNWLKNLIGGVSAGQNTGLIGATGTWERNSDDPQFPNIHLRSNGFLISKEILLKIECPTIKTKSDASHMESGATSITQQIMNMGYNIYAVDRNGHLWPPRDWPKSKTFRSGHQEGLLIADNRTRAYDAADDWEKEYLTDLAWTNKRDIPNPHKRHKIRIRIRRLLQLVKRRLT